MTKFSLVVASLMVIGLMTGCGGSTGSSDNSNSTKDSNAKDNNANELSGPGIILTLQPKAEDGTIESTRFGLRGEGTIVIDWGDGTPHESVMIDTDVYPEHLYAQVAEYTIKLMGENIQTFNNSGTRLMRLDVSKSPALETLYCFGDIDNLDLSNNTKLDFLKCSGCKLKTLDVSKMPALKALYCERNQLTTLDVTKNPALKYLWCEQNQLTALDVSNNPALELLKCSENKIAVLDFSKNPAIEDVTCTHNGMTNLIAGNNPKLKSIWAQYNELPAQVLNTLFESLHSNNISQKAVVVNKNSGEVDMNKNIATKKGWDVR